MISIYKYVPIVIIIILIITTIMISIVLVSQLLRYHFICHIICKKHFLLSTY